MNETVRDAEIIDTELSNDPKVMQALAIRDLSRTSFAKIEEMPVLTIARSLVQSGYFSGQTLSQMVTKMLFGRDLGLGATESVMNIYVTEQGRVGIMAQAMGSRIKSSNRYDYDVVTLDDKACILEWFALDTKGERVRKMGQTSFTMEQARKANLVKGGGNWDKYPEDMLFARALSRGYRRFCPDVFGKNVSYQIHTREELQDSEREERERQERGGVDAPIHLLDQLDHAVRAEIEALAAQAPEMTRGKLEFKLGELGNDPTKLIEYLKGLVAVRALATGPTETGGAAPAATVTTENATAAPAEVKSEPAAPATQPAGDRQGPPPTTPKAPPTAPAQDAKKGGGFKF